MTEDMSVALRWAFHLGQVVEVQKGVRARAYPKQPMTRLSDLGQGHRGVILPVGRYEVSMMARRRRYVRHDEYREEYRYLLRPLDRANPLSGELILVWEDNLLAAVRLGEPETRQQLPLRRRFPVINRVAMDIAEDHLRPTTSSEEDAVSNLADWLGENIENAIRTALEMYDAGQLPNLLAREVDAE